MDAESGPTRIAGVGLGLRWDFDDALVEALPPVDFLEVAPENYIGRGGYHADALAFLAGHYPMVTHGLSMSLGGTDPLDAAYLCQLRDFVRAVRSPWHSDHLSFGTSDGRVLHDLLPIALTEAGVRRVVDRVRRARDAIGVPLAVENISFYLPPGDGEMTEAEFIARVCAGADCGLLLDVNNLYVNSQNFGFDTGRWLDTVPLERVVQLHVAGHEWFDDTLAPRPRGGDGALIVDTHGADVPDPVFALLRDVLARRSRAGARGAPIVLERDHHVPRLPELLGELAAVKATVASALPTEERPPLAEPRQPAG